MDESHVGGMLDAFVNALPRVDTSTSAEAKRASGKADFLVLTCIDYRYPHVIHNYLRGKYPGLLYDQVNLAGASLATSEINTKEPSWRETALDHVQFAIAKHDVKGVLILNHRTCGAFVEFGLLPEGTPDRGVESGKHRAVATAAAADFISLFYQLGKPGAVLAYLTPIVTDPAANDFPECPEQLCCLTT